MYPAPHRVRTNWKKSSYSGDAGCVEVALDPTLVGVRDSKDAAGPAVYFDGEAWRTFIAQVRAGRFDLPHS